MEGTRLPIRLRRAGETLAALSLYSVVPSGLMLGTRSFDHGLELCSVYLLDERLPLAVVCETVAGLDRDPTLAVCDLVAPADRRDRLRQLLDDHLGSFAALIGCELSPSGIEPAAATIARALAQPSGHDRRGTA